jgi:hypothetical protein
MSTDWDRGLGIRGKRRERKRVDWGDGIRDSDFGVRGKRGKKNVEKPPEASPSGFMCRPG